MPKLILKKNTNKLLEFEFKKAKQVYLIGSDPQNDIVIKDDKAAVKHLKIEKTNNCYYVEDLNSQFGTILNGKPLSGHAQIVHGDEISIGEHQLSFDTLSFPSVAPVTEKQMDETNDALEVIGEDEFGNVFQYKNSSGFNVSAPKDQSHSNRESSRTDSSEFYEFEDLKADAEPDVREAPSEITQSEIQTPEQSSYSLLAIYGPYLGKTFPLKSGETKIGRDNSLNDIVLRNNEKGALDPSISRRHATVLYKNGKYFINDKRSKTRTYVNQIKLDPADEYPIYEGDEIEIVSDQKSTIFRLAREGQINYNPPQKAGTWRVRYGFGLGTAFSFVFAAIAVFSFGLSCKSRLFNHQKPENLKFFEETWYQDQNRPAIGEETAAYQSNLAIADLTGDGKLNVVFTDAGGRLKVLDGVTKNKIWEDDHLKIARFIPIVLADLNQNGLKDVLVVGSDIRLRAFDGTNGAEIWLSPILGEQVSGPPVVGDFNGDALQDVLICTQTGRINIGYGDVFQMNWQTIETGLTINAVPTATDWDGNDLPEIFVGTEEGKVLIIAGDTGRVSKIFDFYEEVANTAEPQSPQLAIRYPVAVADVNNDDIIDLIIGATTGEYLAVTGNTMKKIWFDKLHTDYAASNTFLAPAIGKISDKNLNDVALISDRSLKVVKGMLNPGEKKQIAWEYYVDGDDYLTSPITLADLNKDGTNDVIAANTDGSIFIFNGTNGKILTQIHNSENPVVSPLLVADLGEDNYLDILFVRHDGHLYKIQCNSTINKNAVVWGQAFANAAHTCLYSHKTGSQILYFFSSVTFGFLFFLVSGWTFSAKQSRLRKMNHKAAV